MKKRLNLYDHKAYELGAWLAVAAMAAGMVHRGMNKEWTGVFVTGFFFLLALVINAARQLRIPGLLRLLFALSGILVATGYVWDLYPTGLFDELTHFFCSFTTTALVGFLFYRDRRASISHMPLIAIAFTIANLGVSVSVVWEFFEYFVGILGDLEDTLSDLALDMLGAALGGLLSGYYIKLKKL